MADRIRAVTLGSNFTARIFAKINSAGAKSVAWSLFLVL